MQPTQGSASYETKNVSKIDECVSKYKNHEGWGWGEEAEIFTIQMHLISLKFRAADPAKTTSGGNNTKKDEKPIQEGNRIAHGGCVIGDVEAIQYAETKGSRHTEEYKANFHQTYGLPFDHVSTHGSKYPPQLLSMLDIHAAIKELNFWKRPKANANMKVIEDSIDQMLAEVKVVSSMDRLPELFEEGGRLFERSNLMERTFIDQD